MRQPELDASASIPSPAPGILRLGGWCAILGAVLMFTGAILWQVSGTDLDAALAAGEIAAYLSDAADNGMVVLNLTAWIVGVILMGAGGLAFVRQPGMRPGPAHSARVAFLVSVPVAVVSFVAWLAVVVQLPAAPSAAEVAVAEVVGWFASRADWTATALIVGFGPMLVSLAGRDAWLPGWLAILGWVAGLAGLATVVAMFAGGLDSYGFAVVPIGLIWMIGAGVTALRG